MILTKSVIKSLIDEKKIGFNPFNEKQIGPASVDLTLDSKLRVFKEGGKVLAQENVDYKRFTERIDISKGFTLLPGQLVFGLTREKITLPEDICGWLQSRSRFARLGLMSHITAPFIAPGVCNHQVLEIYNAGQRPIRLIPGQRICHIILQRCEGKSKYKGRYKNQSL